MDLKGGGSGRGKEGERVGGGIESEFGTEYRVGVLEFVDACLEVGQIGGFGEE